MNHRRDHDAAARERIRSSLDESLLVEAAAGTGKTTQLVHRLVAILASGRTTVDRLVAVTFTRKAAGEMRLRLREELDRARTTEPARRRHLEEAIARLEEAHIGTIHSFCGELLRERPVEARVDPGFQEMDEDEASALYERAFRAWVERKLGEMPEGLRRALSRETVRSRYGDPPPLDRIRAAGRELVDWRHFPASWRREPLQREERIDALVDETLVLAGYYRACSDTGDYLRRAIEPADALATWVERSEAAAGPGGVRDYDELEARLICDLHRGLSWKKNWRGRGRLFAEGVQRDDVVTARDALLAALAEFKSAADADLAALLHRELDEVTRAYEDLKLRAGRLDFLDLLLRARALLRDNAEVRRFYQGRFTHIFVDEFQDTDPLQAEILLLLTADDPQEADWRRVRPVPGKLFLVGDPKQSIYRFRGADILLYQAVKEQLTAPVAGADPAVALVHLTRSFRAVRPLQVAVNHAFAPEMTGDRLTGQPDYVPLEEHRSAAAGQPALVALPVPSPYGFRYVAKAAIDRSLPDTVAAYVAWLLEESGWTVEEPSAPGVRVALAPHHICLLFRRFVSWRSDVTAPYTRAFEARGIPHLLVGGRSLHQREEVETLRAALTAIEWPDDELAVFATLKRSLFAVPDALLLRFRKEVGGLHPFRPLPADLPEEFHPIAEALALLAELHRRRNRVPVVTTIHRLLEATRAHAAFALRPAGHQILANVQQICELARRHELRGGISFRGFVQWLEQEAEQPESRQAPVLEEGAEGVRLMTVHNAKGLEFPVVLLADITARLARDDPGRYVDTEASLAASNLLGCSPWELLDHAEIECARDAAEGLRIAYVAATRARDLLVVPAIGDGPFEGWVGALNRSLYPPEKRYRLAEVAAGCPRFGEATVLERPSRLEREEERSVRPGLHRIEGSGHSVVWWDPAVLDLRVLPGFGLRQERILAEDEGGETAAESLAAYRGWQTAHRRSVAEGGRPLLTVTPVTRTLVPPDGYEARIDEEILPRPPERPAGVRFGTLVHTVLRDAPLDAGESAVRSLARLQARVLEATPEEEAAAVAAVVGALRHPVLERAAGAERLHREAPFVLRLDGGRLIEGTLDLAFLDQDGWTVVDFKTDLGKASAGARAAGGERDTEEAYRRQLAWYLFALERITGSPARGLLLGV